MTDIHTSDCQLTVIVPSLKTSFSVSDLTLFLKNNGFTSVDSLYPVTGYNREDDGYIIFGMYVNSTNHILAASFEPGSASSSLNTILPEFENIFELSI